MSFPQVGMGVDKKYTHKIFCVFLWKKEESLIKYIKNKGIFLWKNW